ncbi:MAG: NAD(P)H-dependent flavin oxidoreductase, partial [Chitinophagales bacterium]
ELASAVSNAGGLGLLGSGSMYPDILRAQIKKCKAATSKPFGVNIPLFYPDIEKHMQIVVEEGVKIVFTSAGNPKTWTAYLKSHGITVVQVVSSKKFALKSQEAGCDAVVAEGFEAGGHNGREETTTLCLIPMVADAVEIPVIAAGGVGDGRAMYACMALGAEGVQVGSRFAASVESSAHPNFKKRIIETNEGDTELTLKELTPVRLIKNKFYSDIQHAYAAKADVETLKNLLGRGRAKKGMFEGDLDDGELEIGQISATFNAILPAAEIVNNLWNEFLAVKDKMQRLF